MDQVMRILEEHFGAKVLAVIHYDVRIPTYGYIYSDDEEIALDVVNFINSRDGWHYEIVPLEQLPTWMLEEPQVGVIEGKWKLGPGKDVYVSRDEQYAYGWHQPLLVVQDWNMD